MPIYNATLNLGGVGGTNAEIAIGVWWATVQYNRLQYLFLPLPAATCHHIAIPQKIDYNNQQTTTHHGHTCNDRTRLAGLSAGLGWARLG